MQKDQQIRNALSEGGNVFKSSFIFLSGAIKTIQKIFLFGVRGKQKASLRFRSKRSTTTAKGQKPRAKLFARTWKRKTEKRNATESRNRSTRAVSGKSLGRTLGRGRGQAGPRDWESFTNDENVAEKQCQCREARFAPLRMMVKVP